MAKTSQTTDVSQRPFKDAGAFLRKKRKAAGYKTQKAYIQALKELHPTISCSEPYISLIEKGVKIPALKLFNIMAEVLGLTPTEKGELLLSYKRVPRDFEFAVRDNLKAAARTTYMDQLQARYRETPSQEAYRELLTALVLQQDTDEALLLLKEAPIFENEPLELQLRTAQIASLSGNARFALSAFKSALQQAGSEAAKMNIQRYMGIHYFQQGLLVQDEHPIEALEAYLEALESFQLCLAHNPNDAYLRDERARCAYNVGDVVFHLHRQKQLKKPSKSKHPKASALYNTYFGDSKTLKAVLHCSDHYFERARQDYAQVIQQADRYPLPEKALQEAIFFHSYAHGKLRRFETAQLLLHSSLFLKPNWLLFFMKAGLSIMEYESGASDTENLLDQALSYLEQAREQNPGALRQLIQDEKERELKTLWQERAREMETLSHDQ
jgi:hypothetical protein